MAAHPLPSAVATAPGPPPAHLRSERLRLADGARTTLHVARHDLARRTPQVVRLPAGVPLAAHCALTGIDEALVGGFFVRPGGEPLGELRTGGMVRAHVPFSAPWGALRACLQVQDGRARIARRDLLDAEPAGDLLQAGPLLVDEGRVVEGDAEGFSAGAHQFDSDITQGRHPRAALGLTARGEALAVVCDGRAHDEAGLTLGELAEALVALGAVQALNLDGGGSAALVCGGELRNVPRGGYEEAVPGGRAVPTAVVFTPR